MANRLADESSPYLLQHKDNPVDWYPWGAEALAKAQDEQLPIFLSIGYSACHWCHVMERESFENAEIARQLNTQFVPIKVDREQRPDLDQIYMQAVQLISGRGGWPMSVFLTPEAKPFFGGTYWPPQAKMGMPGFGEILQAIADAWQQRQDELFASADQLLARIESLSPSPKATVTLEGALIQQAAATLERQFDFTHGGFSPAPKFPHAMDLQLLLRHYRRQGQSGALDMVRLSLDRMAAGGIYDHLGGGFARYSVDERWLVPHFEKMLYDNALLARVYLEAYQVCQAEQYACIVRETLDYVLREMTDPAGGFYSAEDADSEGVEGKYYVWTVDEVHEVLGSKAGQTFATVYDVTPEGNFEGASILNLPKTLAQCAELLDCDLNELTDELAHSRQQLLAHRQTRIPPGKDDKVLTSWNALMIDAMARAAGVLDEPRYLAAAADAANFILNQMCRADGRLLHCWRAGQASVEAYLDDYAALIEALISLYEADFQARWIDEAVRLADDLLNLFADPTSAGFFFTASDQEQLITRPKDFQDSSTPSGNSLTATALWRLGRLTGRSDYIEASHNTLSAGGFMMEQHSMAAGQLLLALDMQLGPFVEIVLTADPLAAETADLLSKLRRRFLPNHVLALCPPNSEHEMPGALTSLLTGKSTSGPQPTAYVCENFACQEPAQGGEAILASWERLSEYS